MSNTPKVLLIYTSDTKTAEGGFIRSCLEEGGVSVIHLDPSVREERDVGAEIKPSDVAAAAGFTLQGVRDLKHEGKCLGVMMEGAQKIALDLFAQGLSGVIAVGGSMGTSLATSVMQLLPFGIPKVMISTMASGMTRPFVGTRDIAMFHSVADISGLNSVTRSVFRNAAIAMAAMARDYLPSRPSGKPLALVSTLGTTEACSKGVRERLESRGYEVVTFHTTGTGGAALDEIAVEQDVSVVVDMSLVEINDLLNGGLCSAGPDRARAALRRGIPTVFAPGNVDFIIAGPITEARKQFPGGRYHEHNPALTAVRAEAAQLRRFAEHMAEVIAEAKGPVAFLVPLEGFSNHDSPAGYLHDTSLPPVLAGYLRELLPAGVAVQTVPCHMNDPAFADALVDTVLALRDQADRTS